MAEHQVPNERTQPVVDTRLSLEPLASSKWLEGLTGGMAVEAEQLLQSLEASGALTAHQAARLLSRWPDLGDWAADPYFGTVREHTYAHIERAADSAGSAKPIGQKEGINNHFN